MRIVKISSSLIFHETSLEIAFEIVRSRIILANDPHCECANFYRGVISTSWTENLGISLVFRWSGTVENRCETTKKLNADVLYDFSTNLEGEHNPQSYWCSRIYPDTVNGLFVIGAVYTNQEDFENLSIKQKFILYRLNRMISSHPKIRVLSSKNTDSHQR